MHKVLFNNYLDLHFLARSLIHGNCNRSRP